MLITCLQNINDTHGEKLCLSQLSTRIVAWLLMTFFICLHDQLSYEAVGGPKL